MPVQLLEATSAQAFGLTISVVWPSNLSKARPISQITADAEVFLLGGLRSFSLCDEIPALPPVIDVPCTTGLYFHRLEGTRGPCWRLWFGGPEACCDYIWSADYRKIWVRWSERSDVDKVVELLFDTVMAWTARLRGNLCLHASVVASANAAITILAPSGSGKSTLAASLARWHDWSILSDDTAVLAEDHAGYIVHPGRPYLRMDATALTALAYEDHGTTPDADKLRVPLGAGTLRFHDAAQRLIRVYILERGRVAQPTIETCSLVDAAGALSANLYPAALKPDHDRRIREHFLVTRLLQHVPCRVLRIPDALTELPMVSEAIVRDVESEGQ
jgi:hypothetical protein